MTNNPKTMFNNIIGQDQIKIALTVAGEPVAIPLKKGPESDALKAEIDRILQEARDNGKLAELSVKYFGVDLTVKAD